MYHLSVLTYVNVQLSQITAQCDGNMFNFDNEEYWQTSNFDGIMVIPFYLDVNMDPNGDAVDFHLAKNVNNKTIFPSCTYSAQYSSLFMRLNHLALF